MSKSEQKRTLVGPFRSIHGAVWLIGLAILFWKGWFWPGILVLVAISMALEGIIMVVFPNSYETEDRRASPAPIPQPASPAAPAPVAPEHRLDLLPTTCPRCGGPIRSTEVKWTGVQSADCPYCGTNLPMGKA